MPDPANALYPNGPSKSLGNERMSKIFDVPMPKEGFSEHGGDTEHYAKVIEEFIEANRLQKDDVMRIKHPTGEIKQYKYLGPDSGGDWDYMEIKQQKEVPTS